MKMSKFEKKFGKYAIPNLTLILIACYIGGYILQFFNINILYYFTLDPYRILHGEIWRLITWVLVPPTFVSGTDFFGMILIVIMLHFYYNIGTILERTWGTYRYNVYLFRGILLNILASFLYMGYLYVFGGNIMTELVLFTNSILFSTDYIVLTMLILFALTYPDMQVYFMFVIPLKMKWLAVIEFILLGVQFYNGGSSTRFVIVAALVNLGIFYLQSKKMFHMRPAQVKRRAEFKSEVKRNTAPTRHKCAICGRTEETHPDLEFRYCSKCNGNYEYCQDHLFTHEHVK